MTIAAYGRNTERAVQALLAKRAAEQRAKEAAEQAERNRRIEAERAEAERLKRIRLMELAQEELEKIQAEEAKALEIQIRWKPKPIETIKRRACKVFRVTEAELVGHSRNHRIMPARLFVYYWAARTTRLSLKQIGNALGGKDHTSILSGKRRYVALRAKENRNLRAV